MRQMVWSMMAMAILVGGAGCKRSDQAVVPTPAVPAAATAIGEPTSPALHPCAILTDSSVALAVADAQAGQRVDDDEAVGISACRWPVGAGAVVLQVFDAGPGSLADHLRAASLEVVEFRRPDAASVVRLVPFDGVGDEAGAYVEQIDSKRGIRKSNAVLMVQKGNRLAVLRVPQLADGDRALALASMKKLGMQIASGL